MKLRELTEGLLPLEEGSGLLTRDHSRTLSPRSEQVLVLIPSSYSLREVQD